MSANNTLYLITTYPISNISGGNIFNNHIVDQWRQQGIEIHHKYTAHLEHDIKAIPDDSIIIIDSICLTSKCNWMQFGGKKLYFLLHMFPSTSPVYHDDQDVINSEQYVTAHFPFIFVGNNNRIYAEKRYNVSFRDCLMISPGVDNGWQVKNKFSEVAHSLVCFKNIIASKGIERVISTMSHLIDYDWTLDIYGSVIDKSYLNHLYHLISKEGIDGRITFKDTVDHSKVNDIMAQYDLLLHLSDVENHSMTIVESIATNLPFVSTPTGNHMEYMHNKVGHITNGFDAKAISSEIDSYFYDTAAYDHLCQSVTREIIPNWNELASKISKFVSNS